jgi:hypothetical protein
MLENDENFDHIRTKLILLNNSMNPNSTFSSSNQTDPRLDPSKKKDKYGCSLVQSGLPLTQINHYDSSSNVSSTLPPSIISILFSNSETVLKERKNFNNVSNTHVETHFSFSTDILEEEVTQHNKIEDDNNFDMYDDLEQDVQLEIDEFDGKFYF